MYIPIYYSSVTGNTKSLVSYLRRELKARGHKVDLIRSSKRCHLREADFHIIAFWCRRTCMDDMSLQILSLCEGQDIMAIGTMGGHVQGDYGKRVERNVQTVIEERNHCMGISLCQGAIDLKRIRRRMQLPEDNPHHADERKYNRALQTQGHPDEEDMKQVLDQVLQVIEKR